MLSLPSNPRTTQPPPCPRKRVFSHFCASFLFWLPPFMVLAPSPSSNKRAVGRLRAEFPISALPERIIVASLHFVQWQASDFSSKRVWLLVCRNDFDLLLRLLVLAFPHRRVLHTLIRVFTSLKGALAFSAFSAGMIGICFSCSATPLFSTNESISFSLTDSQTSLAHNFLSW